ncbi:FG-GAP-like repeat-containing protein [Stieleria sp. TO1_6]|uniref:FG-GAP-like repeat-containing protein n=1 Tax=Stieleria tagensis TaxID=2956795 RepID=UPI00209B0717|nr:FG-GAP-like repeat-containing protein [Stieleria tagensis]MCO8122300.1 FG-GAP-like repeat-containing protein [Stieleria tagensis]
MSFQFSRAAIAAALVWFGCLIGGCGASSKPNVAADPESESTAEPAVASEPLNTPSVSRQESLDRVDQLVDAGQIGPAAELLYERLIVEPEDVEVVFRLANLRAAQNDLDAAVELLDTIPIDHPEAGLPALGQAADWCFELGRYDQAEQKFLSVLERVPDAVRARRQLAWLLNRQGRRHEAAVHVRELCRLGNVRQDELHSLIVLSDAMVSEPDAADPSAVVYEPIGASGKARQLFTERRYAEAAALLRETIANGDAPPAVVAFYGRAVAEAQDDESFQWWMGRTDESVRQFSEYWAAVTAYLASQQQHQAAARTALEALDRDPTDFISINRLSHLLKIMDQSQPYEVWEQRWKDTHEVLLANNRISAAASPDVDAMQDLAAHLVALDRKLEAILWKSLETHYRSLPADAMEKWNLERKKLVAAGQGFPGRPQRLCGMKLDAYPLPELKLAESLPASQPTNPVWSAAAAQAASLRNVAEQVGLTHRFQPAAEDLEFGFSMYHQAGGGVAVLDYDHDGNPDLYFAQGAAGPDGFVSEQANPLYRSIDGRLSEVTAAATAEEFRYTIGCTAGDWNQDGLPDLIAANIGQSTLWINNGDGTFNSVDLPGSEDLQRMPSSIAIADLDGDHLPDIFELNYIQDPDIAKLPPRDTDGNVTEAVGPGDFASAIDRIGIGDGRGGVDFQPISDQTDAAHKGLGVVIADLDGKPGNEVFVGNDKSANQFWVRDAESGRWSDDAVIHGLAYSSGGAGTASMGIASSDFDKNGSLDLHIANFQNESVCLYLNQGAIFRDRAMQFQLGVPSRSVLGFGSQALDYDNDGLPDLVVSNGHIDKYNTMSGPFEQLPQLFANLGGRFESVAVDDPSGYWQTPHLGRGLARLDFDRDGSSDIVITHLGERSALLLNQTKSNHHWLQLVLVGVQTERDAIGCAVTIQCGDRRSTEWMVGGDGYLVRNEAVISFGLGEAATIDQVEVRWPSGSRQQFENLDSDRRYLIVENQSEPFLVEMPGGATKRELRVRP